MLLEQSAAIVARKTCIRVKIAVLEEKQRESKDNGTSSKADVSRRCCRAGSVTKVALRDIRLFHWRMDCLAKKRDLSSRLS